MGREEGRKVELEKERGIEGRREQENDVKGGLDQTRARTHRASLNGHFIDAAYHLCRLE